MDLQSEIYNQLKKLAGFKDFGKERTEELREQASRGLRSCSSCYEIKSISDFRDSDKTQFCKCYTCRSADGTSEDRRAANREWRSKNRERARELCRQQRLKNPPKRVAEMTSEELEAVRAAKRASYIKLKETGEFKEKRRQHAKKFYYKNKELNPTKKQKEKDALLLRRDQGFIRCNKCDAEKPVAEFRKESRSYLGYTRTCETCLRAQAKKWYTQQAPERSKRDTVRNKADVAVMTDKYIRMLVTRGGLSILAVPSELIPLKRAALALKRESKALIPEDQKYCNGCGEIKPKTQFYKHHEGAEIKYRGRCKCCVSEKLKLKYHALTPEEKRARNRELLDRRIALAGGVEIFNAKQMQLYHARKERNANAI